MEFSHRFSVQIPYFQFDQQGVVFNMWYLAWFDAALVEFFAAIGCPYDRLLADGVDQQLVHSDLDWREGVRFGDRVEIDVYTDRIGTTSFTIGFDVHRVAPGPDVITASGRTVYVNVGETGNAPLSNYFRTALKSAVRRG